MTESNFFPTLIEDEPAVGTVTIKNDELVIGREEQLVHVYIQPESREKVRVGDYLRIPYETNVDDKERMMFGAVEELRYRQKTEFDDQNDADLQREIAEHNYSYIARIEPIAIVVDDDEENEKPIIYERKTVSRPPRPQSRVFIVKDKVFLQSGLELPKNGDFAGFLSVAGEKVPNKETPLPYYFENPEHENEGEAQIFRHSMVCGDTGMGKTHFSKNILRQFADGKRFEEDIPKEEREADNITDTTEPRKLNISIIDPEDEYIDMRDGDLEKREEELCEKHNINYGGIDNDPDVEIEAWQPSINGDYESRGDRTFHIPFTVVKNRPELLLNFETGDATRQAISELVSQYFDEMSYDSSDKPTYKHFNKWLKRRLDNFDNDSVRDAIERRLIDSNLYYTVFDQGGMPLDECANEMFRRGNVTIFPMEHIKGRTEELVVMSLLSYIVDNQLSQSAGEPYINGTPMLLCVDEAHKYIDEPTNRQEYYIVDKFRETAKRGRKENFGLYVVTQNPQDIDEDIRQQVNTKIFLGLDANIVESHDVHVPSEYKNRIKEFDQGEAVIRAPGKRPVEVQGLPFCVTKHKE